MDGSPVIGWSDKAAPLLSNQCRLPGRLVLLPWTPRPSTPALDILPTIRRSQGIPFRTERLGSRFWLRPLVVRGAK